MPPGQHLPIESTIPVLFWGAGYEDGRKPFAEQRPDGSIVFYADIIAATFFMLTRWEEIVVPTRDHHARFPATASVAYRQGFLDRPLIDEYALILRAWLRVLNPQWRPAPHKFAVKLTHDVDFIRIFPNPRTAVRAFAGAVLKRRDLRSGMHILKEVAEQTLNPRWASPVKGLYRLAELSYEYGFKDDAFYFMTNGPGPFNCGYPLSTPVVQRCIDDLRHLGFEIGIHPGYDTYLNPDRLAAEKSRLDALLGETDYGGRQHYLRFRVPNTWRHWEQVGLRYDSTLGYAEYSGFRCGTCHPFKPFDLLQEREIDLWEYPLILMDGTLKHYRQLSPQVGKELTLSLAKRCQQVEGVFTMLWHNTSLSGDWKPWLAAYQEILEGLRKLQNSVK